jgi:glutamine amidotransferase
MFYIALTFGLGKGILRRRSRAWSGLVEKIGKTHGIDHPMRMTLAVGDGTRIWFFRYASDGKAPTLYFSTGHPRAAQAYPDIPAFKTVGDEHRMVVSEPFVDLPGAWQEGAAVELGGDPGGEDQVHGFAVI